MDRIGKIFGRKPGQTEPHEESKAGQVIPPAETNPGSGDQEKSQELFGLKLVLETGQEFALTTYRSRLDELKPTRLCSIMILFQAAMR